MTKDLFLEIVKSMGETDLYDFTYEHKNKIYAFSKNESEKWTDEGKYQYKNENGQLIEIDENYNELNRFNFGVSRSVTRSGSYFSDYNYEYDEYEPYEINEITVPEVVIPAHKERKWELITK